MNHIVSNRPRFGFLRWAAITVPIILLLGFASARFVQTGSRNTWYMALVRPAETPPDWAFPAAWTTIYFLLGIALAMILDAGKSRQRRAALLVFGVQMVANLIWSPLFFGLHLVLWALVDLGAMFAAALATAILVGRIRRGAGWLLVPYLVWLLYAGLLTFRIWQLNPEGETLVLSSLAPQIVLALI